MRVLCPHCQQKALITSTTQLSPTVKSLYCVCTNTQFCSASFVYMLSHSHDINPPQKTTVQIAAELIKTLPNDQRKQLQIDLFN